MEMLVLLQEGQRRRPSRCFSLPHPTKTVSARSHAFVPQAPPPRQPPTLEARERQLRGMECGYRLYRRGPEDRRPR